MNEIDRVRESFDLIASASAKSQDKKGWGHNNHYHKFLLSKMPKECVKALDIGCGTGSFARLLAERSGHVLALDLSPVSVELAKEQSKDYSNINYELADVITYNFPDDYFDCIASIATFHHLPLEEMLIKAKKALRKNGVLMILDLYKFSGLGDVPVNMIAIPMNIIMKRLKNGHMRPSKEVQKAWEGHDELEHYLAIKDIWKICNSVIPGAKIRRHIYWRYSIIWTKR